MTNLQSFYNVASYHYHNFEDGDRIYNYYHYMLQFARSISLIDSNHKPVTLGWVVGFLSYHGLAKSHMFKLDSIADNHQLSGWNDAMVFDGWFEVEE